MLQQSPLQFLLLTLIALTTCAPSIAVESAWVTTGATGRLIYVPDAQGDRILDFSDVGYRGRGLDLIPENVTTVVNVAPIAGDDTASIQTAIDQVSALPIGPDGFRGAVQLQAGTYDIDSQLEIRASGVVLRGVGRDAGGTVLHGRNPLGGSGVPNQRPLIRVYGSGGRTDIGSTRLMVDKVVPAGSRSFRINVPGDFSVGDSIHITHPSTQAWIDALGMDVIPDGEEWQEDKLDVRYERTITRIEGDRIFINAPLAMAFDSQLAVGEIKRFAWPGSIENVGIENLRGDTDFSSATDEDHAWEFISIGSGKNDDRTTDVWVRNIAAAHFGDSAVVANPSAKRVTVDNAISEDPVSVITGSRRYTYDLSGELGFVTGAQADEGRHDFVNNSTRPAGPNVFHNSSATNANSDAGPHQKWATGTLFDNIVVEGDAINVRNRWTFGTGHGWSGANMVIWNSSADSFRVQNPPTTQNWLIGSTGTIVEDTTFGPQPSGNYDAHGTPVTAGGESSLYDAQMNDARDIAEFRFTASQGNWNDPASWDQRVAPLDVYSVSMRDYLQGDVDDYTFDGGGSIDEPFVDPAWEAFILGSSSHPIAGFDDVATNQNVAFTMQHVLDAGEQVVHASLALALRQGGGDLNTDFVRVGTAANQFQFADLGWDAQITPGGSFVGVLDLGAILPDLQSGAVNVQVNDDTGVDWALYVATVATPTANPDGTTVFIEGGGSAAVDSAVGSVGALNLGGSGSGSLDVKSDGHVPVSGDYTQSSAGTLSAEFADGGFGSLQIGGAANLAGTLVATLDSGFDPNGGDSFQIISAGSVAGEFDNVNLPPIADGLAWNVAYAADAVELNVHFSADFNLDGRVLGNDLGPWEAAYGDIDTSFPNGDADADNDADGDDFLRWQRQLGSTPAQAAVAKIPEPAAGFLALMGAWFVVPWVRRKRLAVRRPRQKAPSSVWGTLIFTDQH